tara:strand:+ start:21683 stop:21868 length:186 start_codon:yes stop_codon:yes gene_type:complete
MRQTKYFKNLRIDGNNVISYTTNVATIDHANEEVKQHGWWSVTTQKHINYVANTLGYNLIK